LVDLTDQKNGVDEEATFPITEVNETDLDLLSPGAVFRWAIGIQRLPGGDKAADFTISVSSPSTVDKIGYSQSRRNRSWMGRPLCQGLIPPPKMCWKFRFLVLAMVNVFFCTQAQTSGPSLILAWTRRGRLLRLPTCEAWESNLAVDRARGFGYPLA
jgi:hypothetical protein